MAKAPLIRLIEAEAFERPVPFRFAFRFGVAEAGAFLAAHGDLYHARRGRTRLAIRNGRLALDTTAAAPGLGSEVEPEWSAMQPLS